MQGRYTWRVAIWGKIQYPVVSWYPHTTWDNSECSVYWYWGSAVVPVYFSPLSWCRRYNFAPNVLWTVSPKVLTNVQIFSLKNIWKLPRKVSVRYLNLICDVQKLPHKTGQKFSKNWRKVLQKSAQKFSKKSAKVFQKVHKSSCTTA